MHVTELSPNESFLRLPDVLARTGRSKTAVYTDDEFPKPVKISVRAVAWRESEIEAWMAGVIERSRVADADLLPTVEVRV